ncbi:MAG: hypothetical protein JST39_12410 [Bacteroidetes bacterium]|nr:hypothetical protein [Bacteroidota bacterium]
MKHLWIILLLSLSAGLLGAQTIRLNNTSVALMRSKGNYSWKVFVDADALTLSTIARVEYLLNPSFPNPQVTVTANPANPNFSYSATGWGEFMIKAKVVFRDARKPPQLINYWLKLR